MSNKTLTYCRKAAQKTVDKRS